MFELLVDKLHDPHFLAMLFAAVAAVATVITLAMPLLAGDTLEKRMKAVALEREKIRQRERERLARGEKITLRRTPKQFVQTIVDQLNLTKWVAGPARMVPGTKMAFAGITSKKQQADVVAYLMTLK